MLGRGGSRIPQHTARRYCLNACPHEPFADFGKVPEEIRRRPVHQHKFRSKLQNHGGFEFPCMPTGGKLADAKRLGARKQRPIVYAPIGAADNAAPSILSYQIIDDAGERTSVPPMTGIDQHVAEAMLKQAVAAVA